MSYTEDVLHTIYNEVETLGIREEFDKQVEKMTNQEKHKHKTSCERWEYALYRIKGGESLKKY